MLIYSQDGLGLGHMRRTSLLAREFLHQVPGASALTLSDSPLGQFFTTAPGHDFLKLPSIRKAGPGEWEAVSLASSFKDVLGMRSRIIVSAIRAFEPDVVLVDHMPHGAMGELIPALRSVRSDRMRVVLGLRDILDDPETVRRRWTAEGAFDALEEFYDDVLVYGSREVLDVTREYDWPTTLGLDPTYCGYVCDDPHRRARRLAAVPVSGPPARPTVLVVAGGGGDAYRMLSGVLDAAGQVHAATHAEFVLVTGPCMPAQDVQALRRQARDLPMVEVRRRIRGRGRVARADLVVAMAGYNTTVELLNAGTPALLIPRSGPSAEQRTRARLFAERNWVRWLDPDRLEPELVADAMVAALTRPLAAGKSPDLRGRSTAVAHLTRDLGATPEARLQSVAT
ncbi:glycosyltransferase [Fodinibacter luteus]|uniref:Glycosyltransferase n=1 Tax=Fodinibacter luteus TaxID=552064 RepID=A0ABP8KMC7_9MICO